MEKQFTVFTRNEHGETFYRPCRDLTLEEALQRSFSYTPVAWMNGRLQGVEFLDGLCAESIAAGRVIEKVDGHYIARGVEEKEEAGISDEVVALHEALGREGEANAAMIARDGQARPQRHEWNVVCVQPTPTAKPALPALTRLADLSGHQIPGYFGSVHVEKVR